MAPHDVETVSSPATKDALAEAVSQMTPPKEIKKNRLWYIHGKAYDLTDFVYKHPGE